MKEKVFTARTVEEAKLAASLEFGVAQERITFEVLELPRKSFLGKLKGDARLKAVYEPDKAEIAVAYLKSVLTAMGIEGLSIDISEAEGGAILNLGGEGLGVIIGRRGETLDALQYLAALVCNKGDEEYFRITVDSCGYRDKRKATLEELAVKIAKNVARTGRTSALEPMNPYERRIIHAAVSTVPGVASRSQGEDPYRKVIISSTEKRPPRPAGGKPGGQRGQRPGGAPARSGAGAGGPGRQGANAPDGSKPRGKSGGYGKGKRDDFFTSFEKEYKRSRPAPQPVPEEDTTPATLEETAKPEEETTTPLYTKIDI